MIERTNHISNTVIVRLKIKKQKRHEYYKLFLNVYVLIFIIVGLLGSCLVWLALRNHILFDSLMFYLLGINIIAVLCMSFGDILMRFVRYFKNSYPVELTINDTYLIVTYRKGTKAKFFLLDFDFKAGMIIVNFFNNHKFHIDYHKDTNLQLEVENKITKSKCYIRS
ncbi:hypothetical protein ABC382_00795 [Lysinibacillus sp. 1P01SD]|uniref:hypothetical protein n=1 Tax=Lysinibacillus sp. 1P01SD TaxID=3132285 RepID=UPI0039A3AC56